MKQPLSDFCGSFSMAKTLFTYGLRDGSIYSYTFDKRTFIKENFMAQIEILDICRTGAFVSFLDNNNMVYTVDLQNDKILDSFSGYFPLV
jgi:hypothetical protein